jgi:hypothetical protein
VRPINPKNATPLDTIRLLVLSEHVPLRGENADAQNQSQIFAVHPPTHAATVVPKYNFAQDDLRYHYRQVTNCTLFDPASERPCQFYGLVMTKLVAHGTGGL